MLIDFTMKNFKSFKEEAVLSAETGERLYKYKKTNTFENVKVPVLKNLLIFGPNGAGKSQIFNALFLMQKIVLNGGTKTVTQKMPYFPFKFDDNSTKEPTTFAVKFEKEGVVYEYSFSYVSECIINEKLVIIQNGKEHEYFNFNNGKEIILPDNFDGLREKIRKNALFLYFAQQQNDAVATVVFKWFVQDLVFVSPASGVPEPFLQLMTIPQLRHEMVSFLNFADFNISDIVVRKEAIQIPNDMRIKLQQLGSPEPPETIWQLYTIHKSYDNKGNIIGSEELSLGEESLGTQKLFVIVLAMIFSQINHNDKTIFIDEFDDSLHSELSSALVRIFNSTSNKNQYVISTHNFNLLDSGIRVDQIYFTEKDFRGCSELKSAFDFTDSRGNARRDAKFAKKYIQGQYGAVPVIDTDSLIDVLTNVKKVIEGLNSGKKEKKEHSS